MRAKMKVVSVLQTEFGETLKLTAVCKSDSYPPDGNDEDNTFARFSPMADMTIQVANPSLWGKFKPKQKFYLDFTEASK